MSPQAGIVNHINMLKDIRIIFLPKIQAMKMNAAGTDIGTHYEEFHTHDEGTLMSRNLLSQIMTKYFLYLTSICRYHGCFINLWETVS